MYQLFPIFLVRNVQALAVAVADPAPLVMESVVFVSCTIESYVIRYFYVNN